ncbi:Histone-lysine N-methyltransferase ASH1L [Portunus trituberculatus]|uniref:Histone-lysine N-methyltransferase ASH1L n=1 Tax=Portunus trituberculatus TaxID=210409 RepID=A0A5B7JM44_PORTR|nr:Histone-lysine N-methyltransferase ASH1L [Portunus trituberculatus]
MNDVHLWCFSGTSDQSVPLTQSQKDDHLVPTQTLLSGEVESSHNDMVAHSTQEDDSGNSKCESFPVRCPCGVQCDDGLMVLCDICQKWQHGVSFDIKFLYILFIYLFIYLPPD